MLKARIMMTLVKLILVSVLIVTALLSLEANASRKRCATEDDDEMLPRSRPGSHRRGQRIRSSNARHFRNGVISATMELDYSTDPRRVVPKVYNVTLVHRDAAALIGQLEGQELPAGLLKGDRIEPKSIQQADDCPFVRHLSAFGGWIDTANHFKKKPVALDKEYPITRPGSKCVEMPGCRTYKISNFDTKYINAIGPDSTELENILRSYGPVGLFDVSELENSKGIQSPHGSYPGYASYLVVGYGQTDEGTKFFKVKNSLGTDWGDNGYAYFLRTTTGKSFSAGMSLFKLVGCPSSRSYDETTDSDDWIDD